MRAKFVFEKFSEKGDPIKDLGIGQEEHKKFLFYKQLDKEYSFLTNRSFYPGPSYIGFYNKGNIAFMDTVQDFGPESGTYQVMLQFKFDANTEKWEMIDFESKYSSIAEKLPKEKLIIKN